MKLGNCYDHPLGDSPSEELQLSQKYEPHNY